MVSITQDFIPKGRVNRPGKKNPCEYITIHETGNYGKGAGAKNHASYVKSAKDSWHYTVDDHEIYQHIPDMESAYHAGDGANGPGNAKSIGIEICVNCDGDFERAKANAAELVHLLMVRHGIPLDHVVQHNHWNGKDCPQTIRKKGQWAAFLALCSAGASGNDTTPEKDKPAVWAAPAWEKAHEKGILDGTRPTDPITRQEVAVVLERLGFI